MAKIVTGSDFQQEVLESKDVVLVDFFAPWCGPCQTLLPIIDSISENLDEGTKVVKVNIDQDGELASKYEVMSIPTMVVFKNGQAVETFVGVLQENEIKEMMAKHK